MNNMSEYCKICKLFNTCEKSKTCSCESFITDEPIRSSHHSKYQGL